jgi:hypothetical protein
MSSTDAALTRRDATPPRKSALPNSAAAARANTISTAGLAAFLVWHGRPHSRSE